MDEDKEIIDMYLSELNEIADSLETSIIGLEKDVKNLDLINQVFRMFHNLKGGAASLGFNILKDIAHYSETLLSYAREQKITLESAHIDLFLESLSAIKKVAENLENFSKEGDERFFLLLDTLDKAAKKASSEDGEVVDKNDSEKGSKKTEVKENHQIKITQSIVDELLLLVGNFMLLKSKIKWLQNRYEQDQGFFDMIIELEQFSKKFQDTILQLRLSPIGPVLNSLNRVARSTAKSLNKKINFETSGGDTLVDRKITEILYDPLMHMVRNSIDHGIEDAQKREKANKPEEGEVKISADYKSGEIHLRILDDGAGLDANFLRKKAIEKGVITTEKAASMSDQEAYYIIFMPGFSGAEKVTETSGRGVGMDVVQQTIKEIGGHIDIKTDLGSGTSFILRLPLSLAIVESLSFYCGGNGYALPQSNVEEVYSISSSSIADDIRTLNSGQRILVVRGSPLPIISLASIIDSTEEPTSLIQVQYGVDRYVIETGDIIGVTSIVSQPLPSFYDKYALFSGVTKQGDNSLLFQIDLVKMKKHLTAYNVNTQKIKQVSENRGAAGLSQESALMTTSDLRRLQQKIVSFENYLLFCFPVQRAKRIVKIDKSLISDISTSTKSFVTLEGKTIPLIWTEELILNRERKIEEQFYLLIIEHESEEFGIPMLKFHGIKRMPEKYKDDGTTEGLIGSTVIDHETQLILDTPALIALSKGEHLVKKGEVIKDEKQFTVLCAEDDNFFAAELIASLKSQNCKVILCEDGLIAKNWLLENDPSILDLIISDIEMPNMNGHALIKWIKSVENLKDIPLIAYTAINTVEMRTKVLDAGALAFVSKMAFDDLLVILDKIKNNESVVKEHIEVNQTVDRFVTFQIGNDWFCIPMANIKEVTPKTPCGFIPESKKYISSVTSFRGEIIPVLDLRPLLKDSMSSENGDQAIIEVNNEFFALRISKIGEVVPAYELQSGYGLMKSKVPVYNKIIEKTYKSNDLVISLLDVNFLAKISKVPQQTNKTEIQEAI